jgi:arabinogalactan oligomer / maltooligosaccharide transport system permease protein
VSDMAIPVPASARAESAAAAAVVTKRSPSPGKWFRDTGWRHLILLLALVFALFPILWVVSAAFSNTGLQSQTLVPEEASLDNFRSLMSEPGHPPFWRWFWNSMIVNTVTAVAQVFLCACAAYAFSRLRFQGRRPGLLALLLVQMFPNLLAVVALFLLMQRIDGMFPAIGLGSIWGLILIYMGGSLGVNTWLMKGFFDTIPVELDEAAMVDGATHTQIFFGVMLPLAAPILAVVALFSFVFSQAEFAIADAILGQNDQNRTLAVGLSRFILAGFDNRWGPFAAGALVAAVPTVALWFFLQRFVVSGLTAGSVKG